jgi:hypothetical protein
MSNRIRSKSCKEAEDVKTIFAVPSPRSLRPILSRTPSRNQVGVSCWKVDRAHRVACPNRPNRNRIGHGRLCGGEMGGGGTTVASPDTPESCRGRRLRVCQVGVRFLPSLPGNLKNWKRPHRAWQSRPRGFQVFTDSTSCYSRMRPCEPGVVVG